MKCSTSSTVVYGNNVRLVCGLPVMRREIVPVQLEMEKAFSQ